MGKARAHSRGQSLVEFAITLPILLIILAGVLDLGRLYYVYVAVTDAAAEGASYAAIKPEDEQGIHDRAQEASGGLVQLEADAVEVHFPSGKASGSPVIVNVHYDFELLTPFLQVIVPGGVLTLHAEANEVILAGDLE